jgi:hypothetical protein
MNTETPAAPAKPGILDPKANLKALIRIVVLLAILGGGIWLFLRYTAGEKAANRVASVVLRQPIELKNVIESLPANSFKGLPISLPYAGTVMVELGVKAGNDVDVYLVPQDQIERVQKKEQFRHLQEFEAKKTRSYRRSGRLAAGTYYIVLFDTTLGILSSSSSDIIVRAKLEP